MNGVKKTDNLYWQKGGNKTYNRRNVRLPVLILVKESDTELGLKRV